MTAKLPTALLIAAALVAPVWAGSRQAAPRSGGGGPRAGGGGPRMSAPSRAGGGGPRMSAPRSGPRPGGTAARSAPVGHAGAARGTAGGIARYGHGGYGYGYGYGYGGYYPYYPYWGSWYPWWGVGYYGCWDCYWPSYGYPAYEYSDGGYGASADEPRRQDPAVIETKVAPSSATVVLDGEDVGFAADYNGRWDRLSVKPGKHSIAFRAKGYRSLTVELDAYPGASYALTDALTEGEGEDTRTVAPHAAPETRPEPPPLSRPAVTGRLRINAEPGDAAIYLDGEYLGLGVELSRIHGALAVSTGTHRLEAARPGFAPAVKTIEVGEIDLTVVELKLDAER